MIKRNHKFLVFASFIALTQLSCASLIAYLEPWFHMHDNMILNAYKETSNIVFSTIKRQLYLADGEKVHQYFCILLPWWNWLLVVFKTQCIILNYYDPYNIWKTLYNNYKLEDIDTNKEILMKFHGEKLQIIISEFRH